MTEKNLEQTYLEARVEGAKNLAGVYSLYAQAPECFVAGVQYALDRLLSMGSQSYSLPYPNPGIGDVVTVNMLHRMAIDILTQAKEKRL
jgi:hypothetical protein